MNDCLKLTSYFRERRSTGPALAADALVNLYARSEIAASVLLQGTRVHLGRHEQAYQIPAYQAICALLYRRCLDGATVLLGVDGTTRGRRQRARTLSRPGRPASATGHSRARHNRARHGTVAEADRLHVPGGPA
jgi:hypothetical protein